MTDPTPSTPLGNASGSESEAQPNYIARSAIGIMRRAERSLSPWSRRLFQAESAPMGTLQRSPELSTAPARVQRSPLIAAKNPTISSKASLTLAHRVQRAEAPTVIQRSPEPRAAHSLETFATKVVQRFPEVAAKYEPKTTEAPETIQRASLPFVGSESAAPEPAASIPSMPAVNMPVEDEDAFYPSISNQESVASQLAERLQTFRDQSPSTPSPREMSRMTAERAARNRTTPANPSTIRRSRVEEIGPRNQPPSISADEPSPAVQRETRETIQRKPVEQPTPQPQAPRPAPQAAPKSSVESPAAPVQRSPQPPTVQRKPAQSSPAQSGSDTESNVGPRPGMPSLSQQLLQRYQSGRDEWEAESAQPDSNLPSFLKTSSTDSTQPTTVQRKAEPDAPSQPPVIEHRESRPVRRAAQPKPAQTVQRKPQDEPAKPETDLPLQSKPSAEPPAQSAPAPTIQRTPEEPQDTVDSEPFVATPPSAPEAPKTAPVSSDLPLATPPAAVQRKPAAEPTVEPPAPTTPSRPEPVSAPQPTIQRKPEPPKAEAAPTVIQRSPEPAADTTPSQPDISESLTSQVVSPTTPTIQRSPEMPLREPTPPTAEPREAIQPPVTPQAEAAPSTPSVSQSLPLNAPPSVQRKPEASAPLPPVSQPEPTIDYSEPTSPTTSSPAAPIQRQVTAEARRAELPLATPRTVGAAPIAVAPTIQRMPAEETASPDVMPLVSMPEPRPAPQAEPKPMAIVQRKPAEAATATATLPFPTLPLARVTPSASSQIQRAETETTTSASTPTDTGSSSSDKSKPDTQKSTVDLNDLARRIYPILKRMLAVERERR